MRRPPGGPNERRKSSWARRGPPAGRTPPQAPRLRARRARGPAAAARARTPVRPATQPTATQQTATQPTATQPTATQPTATQPAATQVRMIVEAAGEELRAANRACLRAVDARVPPGQA